MSNRHVFERIRQLAALCAAEDHPDPAALTQLIACIDRLKKLLPPDVYAALPVHETRIHELEQRREALESEISDLEDEIADLEMTMMDHEAEEPENPDGLLYAEWEDRTDELQDEMDDLEAELDDLQSELDEITSQLDELRG